jgi:hypothetical protein
MSHPPHGGAVTGHHFYGLPSIAAYLGVTRGTVLAWLQHRQLLVYWRQHPKSHRMCWYSNPSLLHLWEVRQAERDVKVAAERRMKRSHAVP